MCLRCKKTGFIFGKTCSCKYGEHARDVQRKMIIELALTTKDKEWFYELTKRGSYFAK